MKREVLDWRHQLDTCTNQSNYYILWSCIDDYESGLKEYKKEINESIIEATWSSGTAVTIVKINIKGIVEQYLKLDEGELKDLIMKSLNIAGMWIQLEHVNRTSQTCITCQTRKTCKPC